MIIGIILFVLFIWGLFTVGVGFLGTMIAFVKMIIELFIKGLEWGVYIIAFVAYGSYLIIKWGWNKLTKEN